MDKIQRKNVNLRNTLLALYNLPQEARIRTVYQAMGIDIDREENSRCMVAWAVRGVVPDAVAAALHRDFPELAEAVLAGTLVIDGIERRALYSISLLRGELAALREDIKDVSNG